MTEPFAYRIKQVRRRIRMQRRFNPTGPRLQRKLKELEWLLEKQKQLMQRMGMQS